MDSREKKIADAESRMAVAVAAGRRHDDIDYRRLLLHPSPLAAAEAFGRLAAVAMRSKDRASLGCASLRLRVRAGAWDGFESVLRDVWRSVRHVADAPSPDWIDAALTRAMLRDVGLAYARFLRVHGRRTHALRVLRRVGELPSSTAKHLAETEAGLICLELDRYETALEHLTRSFAVDPIEDVPVRAGYCPSLLRALEGAGVRRPAMAAAKRKLDAFPIFRGWPG